MRSPAVPYVAPASGPTARLLLRVTHVGGRYTVSNYAQPVSCSRRQEFVSSSVAQPERMTVTLEANRFQTLSFFYQRDDRQACQVIVSFEPKAGNTYLMRNTVDAKVCAVELINATNPESPRVEGSRMVRERVGFDLNDNACKPVTSLSPPAAPKGAIARPQPIGAGTSLDGFKDLLPGK